VSNERKRCLANVHCANTATHGFDGKALACRQHAGDWEEVAQPAVPSAPRHDAGTGDHPAPTCECGARLNLKGQTKCADCIDRMIASAPPSPGGEDVGALKAEAVANTLACSACRGRGVVKTDGGWFPCNCTQVIPMERAGVLNEEQGTGVGLIDFIIAGRLALNHAFVNCQDASVREHYKRARDELLRAQGLVEEMGRNLATAADLRDGLAKCEAERDSLRAQLAAASDRYARAVADADEVIDAVRYNGRGMVVTDRLRAALSTLSPAQLRGMVDAIGGGK